ncbi:acetyl-CoA synthetase [Galdieria sulphuraria]|uniref:Acetyl-coenzyme A synthetase n=1 Tax=Galdieria sulphuraria TaxID=130081 RepID=M2X3T8_GALSU|nr:acetyl-CoA synthetase [Galdieria sulphuraria]EME31090.1 acetyl-CoA synthetase [Galdieria sulphuraria]|eukprot:XP_005707610.1 acetyl-CoA synthetase [Galdieria sulphuraria]
MSSTEDMISAMHDGLAEVKTETGPKIPVPETYLKATKHHLKDVQEYLDWYKKSLESPNDFWSEKAKEMLSWHQLWTGKTLEYNFDVRKGKVYSEWFKGGKLNACYNALDRHVENGHGSQVAYYCEGNDLVDDHRTVTYAQMLDQVKRLASALKKRGVRKGDVVAIYLPNIPELPISMLACARIGAIHNVVFGGFSAEALAGRILDAQCRVLITCDGVMRGNKVIELKALADAAEELVYERGDGHLVDRQIVFKRLGDKCPVGMKPKRDEWWHETLAKAEPECPVEWMDAEDPLFVLYTSGSTGKPKGLVHTTAGYILYAAITHKYAFNYQENDVFFCTADCGWITGHSYVVYGPLLNRATSVIFEGVPTHPDSSRLWQICDKYKVNQMYTAPTLIRSLMRAGDKYVTKIPRNSLRVLGTVGEPINPEAWNWFFNVGGDKCCPVVDTWWQTETGGHMIIPPPVRGFQMKPGAASLPFFGIEPVVLNEKGEELSKPCEGFLCIKRSWPGIHRTVLNDHARMEQVYFSTFKGYYMSGDGCRVDEDGYYWLTGRVDDVINVSGHRIGTAEVESSLVSHPYVAEAAVVPMPHDIKGQGIYAYVTLRDGFEPSEELRKELRQTVRVEIGAIATPDVIHWAPALPKTRSGKIMRRILRKIAEKGTHVSSEELGDITTLAEPQVVAQLIELYGK